MAKNIEAIDWKDRRIDTGVDVDDVESIEVLVLTGDEILTIKLTNGEEIEVDSCPYGRIAAFFDAHYEVSKEEIPEWMERKNSYHWSRWRKLDQE